MEAIFKAIDQKVKFFYPRTRLVIMLISLSMATLPIPKIALELFSFALILSIGLMHGATDHYLYMNAKGLSTKKSIPKAFFVKYLLTLMAMAVAWWIAPFIAFTIFIITSAYHFGQTQWQYLDMSEKSFQKKSIYTLWGLLVLCMIVLINGNESDRLIQSVLSDQFSVQQLNTFTYLLAALLFITFIIIRQKLAFQTLIFELLELSTIFYFSWKGNLLLSFALFFGLWHSLRAAQVQIDKLKKAQPFNWRAFLIGSLPFTLISLIGIAGLLWASVQLDQQIEPEMLFLIAISVLTMPHMVIYEEFYAHHDQKRS